MSKHRTDKLKSLGIEIKLTEQGLENLSKILGEGCPVKISLGDLEPVCCPYTWVNAKYFTCKTCWKQWLKSFSEKE